MSAKVHARFLEVAPSISVRLAEAIERTGPVRLSRLKDANLPYALCRAVAAQQLSNAAAETIWGRMRRVAGSRDFIQHISRAEPEDLRACGLSGAKTKAMQAIAEASAGGLLNESELKRLNHAERSQRLTKVWGVGQWTADMMGIFYFGDRDVWPDGDLAVVKTLQALTGKRRKTALTAERFAPHRTYLALHMWELADAAPA